MVVTRPFDMNFVVSTHRLPAQPERLPAHCPSTIILARSSLLRAYSDMNEDLLGVGASNEAPHHKATLIPAPRRNSSISLNDPIQAAHE